MHFLCIFCFCIPFLHPSPTRPRAFPARLSFWHTFGDFFGTFLAGFFRVLHRFFLFFNDFHPLFRGCFGPFLSRFCTCLSAQMTSQDFAPHFRPFLLWFFLCIFCFFACFSVHFLFLYPLFAPLAYEASCFPGSTLILAHFSGLFWSVFRVLHRFFLFFCGFHSLFRGCFGPFLSCFCTHPSVLLGNKKDLSSPSGRKAKGFRGTTQIPAYQANTLTHC